MAPFAIAAQRDAHNYATTPATAMETSPTSHQESEILFTSSPAQFGNDDSLKKKQPFPLLISSPINPAGETAPPLSPYHKSPLQKHSRSSPRLPSASNFFPKPSHRRSSSASLTNTASTPNNGHGKRPVLLRRASSMSTSQSIELGRSHFKSGNEVEDLQSNLKIRSQVLGASHPEVGLRWNEVGNAQFRRGDHKPALGSYRQALACYQAAYRDGFERNEFEGEVFEVPELLECIADHADIASTLGNMGTAYWAMGQFSDAAQCLEKSLRMRIFVASSAGENIDESAEIASAYYRLGLVRCLCREHEKSMEALLRSHRMCAAIFGSGHLESARVVDALGKVHLLRGEIDRAMDCHRQARAIKQSCLGSFHPSVLSATMNVAAAYRSGGDFKNALEMYDEVLGAQRSILARDKSDPMRRSSAALDVAVTLQILGEVLDSLGDRSRSRMSRKEALLMYKEAGLPADDHRIIKLLERQSNVDSQSYSPKCRAVDPD